MAKNNREFYRRTKHQLHYYHRNSKMINKKVISRYRKQRCLILKKGFKYYTNPHQVPVNIRRACQNLLHKLIVVDYYTKGKNRCTRCPEKNLKVLTIGHTDYSGSEHRKKIGGNSVFNWLIRNGLPKGAYEIQCMNCNWLDYQICKNILY